VIRLNLNCMRCGSESYKVKKVIIPEKTKNIVGVEMGTYYYKICLDCGFVEVYSEKVLEKNAELIFEY